jgi:deaminated glutathione amidase
LGPPDRRCELSRPFRAACIQFTATPEVEPNIDTGLRLTREAFAAGADLVCLPEFFSGVRSDGPRFIPTAFPEGSHPVLDAWRKASRSASRWSLLGSIGITLDDGRGIANRSYLIDSQGGIAARYDKIHLFDVDLGPGKAYLESSTISGGYEAVVGETPWGGLGLSICYDLRFPELYQSLARNGADFLAVPAAFTRYTGLAHWHVLVRARGIETGSYIFAPCQNGTLVGGSECFGHSLIVDPWGQVLADAGETDGFIIADIDPAKVIEARRRIPALANARAFSAPRSMAAT